MTVLELLTRLVDLTRIAVYTWLGVVVLITLTLLVLLIVTYFRKPKKEDGENGD